MLSNVIFSLGVLGAVGLMGSLTASVRAADGPASGSLDLPRIQTVLAAAFQKDLPVEAGGRATVSLGSPRVRRAGNREYVSFQTVHVDLARVRLGKRLIGNARLKVLGLELDHQKLKAGILDCRTVPEGTVDLTLEEDALISHLRSGRGRCKSLSFEGGSMVVAGKVAVAFLSISFRVRGQPVLFGSTLGLRVESVSIGSGNAGPDRVRTAQASLASLVPLAGLLRPIGVAEMRVAGGQLEIQRGSQSLYRRSLESADLAE